MNNEKSHVQKWWLFYFFWVLILAAVLSGCLPITPPQGFEQRVAYGYGANTAILNAAAEGIEAGRLSPEVGEVVLDMSDRARALLDISVRLHGLGDIGEAETQLGLAISVLTELRRYLELKQ